MGRQVLVTAGPTYETIDPVRFIGNYSSGKTGFALAEVLAEEGAHVTLVSGPTACTTMHPNITLQRIISGQEMLSACKKVFSHSDIIIFSAAVADYRPAKSYKNKVKKIRDSINLTLTQNPDIAAELGKIKKPEQYIVGFALETENAEHNAKKKMEKKNFNLIAVNSLKDKNAGFEHDTNKISLIERSGKITKFALKSKKEVASDIVNVILKEYVSK